MLPIQSWRKIIFSQTPFLSHIHCQTRQKRLPSQRPDFASVLQQPIEWQLLIGQYLEASYFNSRNNYINMSQIKNLSGYLNYGFNADQPLINTRIRRRKLFSFFSANFFNYFIQYFLVVHCQISQALAIKLYLIYFE